MSVFTILSHTPLWVWVLFAFVVSRGVRALQPREVAPSRVVLVPAIFLIWGLSALLGGSGGAVLKLVLFAAGLAAGLAGGRWLAALTPAPRLTPEKGVIAMPGSPIALVLICVAFTVKYVGAVELAISDDASFQAQLAYLMSFVGGGFAGLFWGRTLGQFQLALSAAGEPADLRAVIGLVLARAPRPAAETPK